MNTLDVPLLPNRKSLMPIVYGDTPSFLGVAVENAASLRAGTDVVFAGIPWEGAITWGSYSACELAPRAVRHASARYGGFLPEYEIDLFEYLRAVDIGDISVSPNDPEQTMENVFQAASAVYRNGSTPCFIGGDHSTTPAVVRALARTAPGEIGIIHFDAHLDNARSFGNDELARCTPLYRIAEIPGVRKKSIVHVGIRGPRNSPSQFATARAMGARIFNILEIRRRGIDEIVEEAISVASEKTRCLFVTVCSDCIDAFANPGGPADFNGLFPHELFSALFRIGAAAISGLDFVEIYPAQDPLGRTSHLACWAIIHALAGIAARKRDQCRRQESATRCPSKDG